MSDSTPEQEPTEVEQPDPRSLLDERAPAEATPSRAVSAAEALACAQYLLAQHLGVHQGGERGEKMLRVVEKQRSDLDRIEPGVGDPRVAVGSHLASLDPADRIGFLVEVYFLDPFAPYVLRTRPRDRVRAVRRLAGAVGQDPKLIRRIERTAASAMKAYRQVNWVKVGLLGAGSAAALGLGGFLVAPVIGTALGGAAGLAGAAATNFGLALLGGGALAAGGAGMAGGMWLVAAVGATAGVVGGAGGGALFQLGAARARMELVKLQVTFKLAAVDNQVGRLKAQEVLAELNTQLEEMTKLLEEERDLNDENSRRVKDLEETLKALETALEWMEEQEEAG